MRARIVSTYNNLPNKVDIAILNIFPMAVYIFIQVSNSLLNLFKTIRFSQNDYFSFYFLYFKMAFCQRVLMLPSKTAPPFESKFTVYFKTGKILGDLSGEIPRYLTICTTW